MAEDQGKEEEKFGFTGEGEAVGYISLAQARVLAMTTARETPGEYGSQYQNVSMAFETVTATEDEDFYNITLSFRPQGDFSGVPGQEQFFVHKEGTVAIRQVLGLPRATRGRRFPVLPVAIGVVIIGVIAAVAVIFVVGGFGDGGGVVAVAAPTETPVSIGVPTAIDEPTPIPSSVTLNPGTGSPGDSILFYGTGFAPSRLIETLIVGRVLAYADSAVSDADGRGDTKFSIPISASLGKQRSNNVPQRR